MTEQSERGRNHVQRETDGDKWTKNHREKEGGRKGGRGKGSRHGERVMRSEELVMAAEVTDSSLPTLCLYSSSNLLSQVWNVGPS